MCSGRRATNLKKSIDPETSESAKKFQKFKKKRTEDLMIINMIQPHKKKKKDK